MIVAAAGPISNLLQAVVAAPLCGGAGFDAAGEPESW